MNEYSPYKAAHHLDRIWALRNKEIIYPTQIQVDLINLCNHKCPYCFTNYSVSNKNQKIDETIMFGLLNDAVKLDIRSFHYTGGGEPFLHPKIYNILSKTIENGLEYGMVTNGTLIDFTHLDLLHKMSWIRFSMDASDADMYKKQRGVDEFSKAIDNIKAFVYFCTETVVGMSFVVNPLNYKQIVSFAELAKSLSIQNVRYSIAWSPNWKDEAFDFPEINRLLSEAKKLETDTFKIFNLTNGRLQLFNPSMYSVCGYQHFTTVIGADSNVYPCCTLKYIPETSFGSLKEQNFKGIWHGYRRMKWLSDNHLQETCSKNICWMTEKNKFIDYLLQPNPKHVNFI